MVDLIGFVLVDDHADWQSNVMSGQKPYQRLVSRGHDDAGCFTQLRVLALLIDGVVD